MKWKRHVEHLRDRGLLHWLFVIFVAFFGIFVGEQLGKLDFWIEETYELYRIFNSLNWRESMPERTNLVLIGDKEYWGKDEELAQRTPINRRYLARLLYALDKADAEVIALDFDLRSPMTDGGVKDHPAYQRETQELIDAVREVSKRRKVVLPVTVDISDDKYLVESAIFSGTSFDPKNVLFGYINLPYDLRRVALRLPLKECTKSSNSPIDQQRNNCQIDSFALSIARATSRGRASKADQSSFLPYTDYIKAERFCQISATDLLTSEASMRSCQLSHRIVIVGGEWSRWAYERGGKVDTYMTPVGIIGGVFIHANYVEALLDGRTRYPLWEGVSEWIELGLALVVAIVFSLDFRLRVRILITSFLLLGMILFSFFSFFNLGMFFDFFTPVFLLSLHACVERIYEWREKALYCENFHMGNPGEGENV
ncbi:MAG: CHASE2 domain-containing protein [Deltaproteobacteria bacterium]|nr:CHASE2 domain-containing protein [Deltaproteobacteria bacterium]